MFDKYSRAGDLFISPSHVVDCLCTGVSSSYAALTYLPCENKDDGNRHRHGMAELLPFYNFPICCNKSTMASMESHEKSPYEAGEVHTNESRSVDGHIEYALESAGVSVAPSGLQRKLKARHIQVCFPWGAASHSA